MFLSDGPYTATPFERLRLRICIAVLAALPNMDGGEIVAEDLELREWLDRLRSMH